MTKWHERDDRLIGEERHADFASALARLNRIAALAEETGHHPDLALHDWNRLTITLTTHEAGGITERDRRLAAAIDALD